MAILTPQDYNLPFKQRLAFGCGYALVDLYCATWFSYVLVYFHYVVGFTNSMAGYMVLNAQGLETIGTPIFGFIMDRTKGCFGYPNRKTWHLWGSLLVAVCFPFLFSPSLIGTAGSHWWRFGYYIAIDVILVIGLMICQVAHFSLVPNLTSNRAEQTELGTIRYGFTVSCYMSVHIFALVIIEINKKNGTGSFQLSPNDASTFQALALVMVGIGLLLTIIFHVVVKENRTTAQDEIITTEIQTRADGKIAAQSTEVQTRADGKKTAQSTEVQTRADGKITPQSTEVQTRADDKITPQSTEVQTQADDKITPQSTEEQTGLDGKITVPEETSGEAGMVNAIGTCNDDPVKSECESMTWKAWMKECQFYQVNGLFLGARLILTLSQSYFPLYITDSLLMEKRYIAILPLVVDVTGLLAAIIMRPFSRYLGLKVAFAVGGMSVIGASVWFRFIQPTNAMMVFGPAALMGFGASTMFIICVAIVSHMIGKHTETSGFVFGAIIVTPKLMDAVLVNLLQSFHPCRDIDEGCCDACSWYYRDIMALGIGSLACFSLIVLGTLAPVTIGKLKHDREIEEEIHPEDPVRGSGNEPEAM